MKEGWLKYTSACLCLCLIYIAAAATSSVATAVAATVAAAAAVMLLRKFKPSLLLLYTATSLLVASLDASEDMSRCLPVLVMEDIKVPSCVMKQVKMNKCVGTCYSEDKPHLMSAKGGRNAGCMCCKPTVFEEISVDLTCSKGIKGFQIHTMIHTEILKNPSQCSCTLCGWSPPLISVSRSLLLIADSWDETNGCVASMINPAVVACPWSNRNHRWRMMVKRMAKESEMATDVLSWRTRLHFLGCNHI